MAVTLTPAAADRVRHFLAERGHGVGLRLGVRKTGCSGFAYVVNYADAVERDRLARGDWPLRRVQRPRVRQLREQSAHARRVP